MTTVSDLWAELEMQVRCSDPVNEPGVDRFGNPLCDVDGTYRTPKKGLRLG